MYILNIEIQINVIKFTKKFLEDPVIEEKKVEKKSLLFDDQITKKIKLVAYDSD